MSGRKATQFWALALLAWIGVTGCGPGTVKAPTTYKTWNAKDGSFAIQYPAEWKAEGGGQHGIQWAEFSKGSAKVSVKVNLTSSLVGDIAGAAGQLGGIDGVEIDPKLAEELAPVAAAHEVSAELFVDEIPKLKEQEPVAFQSGLGDSRKSEFTAATGGVGSKVRGYRATALTSEKGVHVLARCPDAHWKTLQPAFDQMLTSLTLGTPQ